MGLMYIRSTIVIAHEFMYTYKLQSRERFLITCDLIQLDRMVTPQVGRSKAPGDPANHMTHHAGIGVSATYIKLRFVTARCTMCRSLA